MKDQIFIALSTFATDDKSPLEMLIASGYPYKIHKSGKRITSDELLENGIEASVIVAGVETYDERLLSKLPSLRCISRCGVGVDSIDKRFAKMRNITVANTPLVPVQAVAELALSMFLSLTRNLYRQANLMHKRKWEKLSAHLLGSQTVGLIGFGRIGQRVAELVTMFGSRVLVFDPFLDKKFVTQSNVSFVSMGELLKEADIVSIHASKTAENPVVIGEVEIDSMKDGAILVNLARGEMVDEIALVNALTSGKLSGAGLDVFGEEPYSGPLCDFEQVILTPHSATLTLETRSEMERQCVENAIAFLNQKLDPARKVI